MRTQKINIHNELPRFIRITLYVLQYHPICIDLRPTNFKVFLSTHIVWNKRQEWWQYSARKQKEDSIFKTRQRIGVMKSNTYTFYSTRLDTKNVQLSRSAIKIHETSTKVLLQDFLSKYKLMWSHANYGQPWLILDLSFSFQSLTEKVKNISTNLHAGPEIFIPKLAIWHWNGKYKGFYKQIFTKVLMKRSITFNTKMEWNFIKIFSGLPHSHQDKILCVFPMFLAFPL